MNSGTVVPVSATANMGYQFTGFSGALTGATTPQNLTMSAPASVTASFSTMPTVAAPTFSLAPGSYIGLQTITLSTTTQNATIHYTLVGMEG